MNTDAPKLTPLHTPDIDDVWMKAAARCGFQVVRGQAAYASTDGRGTILVGAPETLDSDDSLAQLVLHELCHALVQGEASWQLPDWGLDNTSDRDDVGEAACLRLQAELSDRHGLRELMTPTTEWRRYYRELPADPLLSRDPDDQPACARAREALALVERKQLGPVLDGALAATAALLRSRIRARRAGRHPPARLRAGTRGRELRQLRLAVPGRPRNRRRSLPPVRGRGGRRPAGAPGISGLRALGAAGGLPDLRRLLPRGLPLGVGVHARPGGLEAARPDRARGAPLEPAARGRSVCGAGGRTTAWHENGPPVQLAVASSARAYHCRIYEDRPRTCREFERAGRHCLTARRRVGLSR